MPNFCIALANFDASEDMYKSKVKERVSGFPHMVCLSFIEKMYENLMLKMDAVSVCINNVIKLCYYLSRSFLCFQVLTAYWTAFKCLLNKQFSSHVRCSFPEPDR